MGKLKKAKRSNRFDPLARGSSIAMEVEESRSSAPKRLNAHQQRHAERKRLQAEAAALKSARRKVSKADKHEMKKQKKALSRSINAIKEEKAALKRQKGTAEGAAAAGAGADEEEAAVGAAPFVFSLPTPERMRE